MGELMRYVVAHEVGHTLGFQHNMKASSTYTIAQVRDRNWVKQNGHTPTLMDYSRFNYVAQPEDNIDPADLIPKIGPYDKWATMWGYKPIPGAKTPDEEKPTLDKWAREQDEKAFLRFSTEGNGGADPGDQTEAVGDSDAVAATRLGLKNLARISEMLMPATSTKVGDPWNELEEVYGRMVSQWQTEMNHVVRVVGSFNSQQKHIGQEGVRFVSVPKEKQVEAVQFILQNAFQTPMFMIRPEILRRIQVDGHRRSHPDRAELDHEQPAPVSADRSDGRAGRHRRPDGLHADPVPHGASQRRLGRARETRDGRRHLSPQPAALVSGHDRRSAERQHRAQRRSAFAAARRAPRPRRGDPERDGRDRRSHAPPPAGLPRPDINNSGSACHAHADGGSSSRRGVAAAAGSDSAPGAWRSTVLKRR